jgi:hypothetical protein
MRCQIVVVAEFLLGDLFSFRDPWRLVIAK